MYGYKSDPSQTFTCLLSVVVAGAIVVVNEFAMS